jgi:hypothetical protein
VATALVPSLSGNAAALVSSSPRALPVGTQLAELKGSDIVAKDGFGTPVAVAGTIAVVGSWQHARQGRAYVFAEEHGLWRESAELKGSDTVAGSAFGTAVAISGKTVVVGAPGPQRGAGRAYVFTSAKGGWTETAELRGSDTFAAPGNCRGELCPGGSYFGASVAVSGTTVLVGATDQAKGAGRVYVFTERGGSWDQSAELKGSGAGLGAEFGSSVAISGTTAIVGAPGDPTGGGRAYVFAERSKKWTEVAELKGSDTVINDYFGSDVAVSGMTAVVGAYGHAKLAGRAYVFGESRGTWRQLAELGSAAAGYGGLFGDAVAISGRTAVVGANFEARNAGRAYLFVERGARWTRLAEIKGSDTVAGDSFGCSVAVSGTTAVVGAFRHAKGAGGAYVFEA